MKLLEEIKVSVYENVYSKRPREMSFLDVITACITAIYASSINTIRRYFDEGNHEAAQKLKSRLPCFTPAGTFDGAHAIKNFLLPSNIIGLDYDHVTNRLELIQLCAADPHTVAALESPTDGIKVFAYVEGIEGRHREAQLLVSQYYDQLLGLESDPACKDESRLCYFTYSPNGYLASLYQPFELEAMNMVETSEADAIEAPNAVAPDNDFPTFPNVSDEETEKFLSSYIFLHPLTTGQRHSNLFRLACEASRRHYPQEVILRELTKYLEHSDFPKNELKNVLSSGYKNVSLSFDTPTQRTTVTPQKDKKTKSAYSTYENDDDVNETYWEGEEFRKKTPLIPQDVYNNLPVLLEDCLLEHLTPREQDISFLSMLTTLSAVLPQTFGIYNHKKYTPHIFCVISSSAGSSKSIAQTGRYLIEEISTRIIATSEFEQDQYNVEYNHWKMAVKKSGNNEKDGKDGNTCIEEPKRPPYKTLFISATTSYTRMQIQMKDNNSQGSIIFDTEAQTLTTANHQDYGNFDDMLRKAFEHENIDSSYKANGMKPITIRYPKLAMLLTGTPGQVEELLGSSEKGTPSRILLYTFREIPYWKEMGDDSISLEDDFKPLAHRVSELYSFCLNFPVLFHFTLSQWKELNDTFSHLLQEVALEGNDDLQAVVKRYACLVMRISMIFTRIRQFENNDSSCDIYCSDEDFDRALQIVLCCYEHSRLILSSMPAPAIRPLKNPDRIRDFINELPDTFTTDEANEVGANHDFGSRKVARLLKSLNGLLINKITHGNYTKIKKI